MKQSIQTFNATGLVRTDLVDVSDPSPEQVNADTLRARADQSIAGLAQIKNSAGTLTALQLSNAVRLLATVLLAILRLQLGRLEDTDG